MARQRLSRRVEELLAKRPFEIEHAVSLTALHRLTVSGSDRACKSWRGRVANVVQSPAARAETLTTGKDISRVRGSGKNFYSKPLPSAGGPSTGDAGAPTNSTNQVCRLTLKGRRIWNSIR